MSDNATTGSPSSASDMKKLQMTNILHSNTRSLPSETLSYIFQLASPPLDIVDRQLSPRTPPHLILRLVSVLWYSVVQSTQQLWTSFYLYNVNREDRRRYIRLCLQRSGQLGLHVILYQRSVRRPDNFANEILLPNLHRVESLRINSHFHLNFEEAMPTMSRLKAINASYPPCVPTASNLKWMRLEFVEFDDIYNGPPLTSITCLDLRFAPIDYSIRLLINCPNLVEFSCVAHSFSEISRFNTLPSPFMLDQLAIFSWATPVQDDSRWNDQLFQRLHVPALQRFHLDNREKVDLSTSIFPFFSRLPKSMKELEFQYMDHKVKKGLLREVVNHIEISRISVELCSPLFLRDIFSTLSERTEEGIFRCPYLTCLHVGQDLDDALVPPLKLWVGRKLARLLQDRSGTVDRFTFISGNPLRDWNNEIWGIFKYLKEKGFDLTIIESGKVVNIKARYVKSRNK